MIIFILVYFSDLWSNQYWGQLHVLLVEIRVFPLIDFSLSDLPPVLAAGAALFLKIGLGDSDTMLNGDWLCILTNSEDANYVYIHQTAGSMYLFILIG